MIDYETCALFQVTNELHNRAAENETDKAGFIELASCVEEFTLRFLDPLKYNGSQRKSFSENPETSVILETAIQLEQKKVNTKQSHQPIQISLFESSETRAEGRLAPPPPLPPSPLKAKTTELDRHVILPKMFPLKSPE